MTAQKLFTELPVWYIVCKHATPHISPFSSSSPSKSRNCVFKFNEWVIAKEDGNLKDNMRVSKLVEQINYWAVNSEHSEFSRYFMSIERMFMNALTDFCENESTLWEKNIGATKMLQFFAWISWELNRVMRWGEMHMWQLRIPTKKTTTATARYSAELAVLQFLAASPPAQPLLGWGVWGRLNGG